MKKSAVRLSIFSFTLFLSLLYAPIAHAAALGARVLGAPALTALDTVAGFETKLEAFGAQPSSSIFFDVQKPNGAFFTIPAATDEEGSVEGILSDDQTKVSGIYSVALR